MEHLVDRFSKPGELVADLFSGILPPAKACLGHLQHRRFIGCKVNSKCFAERTEALAERCFGQVMNEKSDISDTDKAMDACKIVVRALSRLQVRGQMRLGKVPDELYPVQIFPLHRLCFAK